MLAIILLKRPTKSIMAKRTEGIYGQATREEREALKDEGIEIFDMPWVRLIIDFDRDWRAANYG